MPPMSQARRNELLARKSTPIEGSNPAAPEGEATRPLTFSNLLESIKNDDLEPVKKYVAQEIESIVKRHQMGKYLVLFLFDEADSISHFHADRLYSAASALRDNKKDILLIVQSRGGSIEPAYLVSKALKKLSKDRFVAAVPRRAKSAATLICLGADEIHMGVMSELGPIDPQFGGLPALGLGNALELIADLTCKFPGSAPLFSEYVAKQAPLKMLGYYQRVSESAVQYGERLLAKKFPDDPQRARTISDRLVNHYKDHSFVIDVDEATELLGNKIVRMGTEEYIAADEIYRLLELVDVFSGMSGKKKDMWLIGASDSLQWRDRKD